MGSLYLYAIVDRTDQALPQLAGIGDAPLVGFPTGALLAVVSSVEAGQVPLTQANLLRHEAVIEALMLGRGVLPARFGTTGSEQALTEAMARHEATFIRSLDRVRGRVELALRVLDPAPPEAPPARPRAADFTTGRGYMQALLAVDQHENRRRAAAEALAEQITAELTPLAEALVQDRAARPKQLLKVAYLLLPERVAEMRERIAAMQAAHPALVFVATGPWPAYSFTEIEQGPSLFERTAEGLR
jgi:hypothetical protein